MEETIKVRGNFLGAAILVVIYTVYLLFNFSAIPKSRAIVLLVILNALLIVLVYFAFPHYYFRINSSGAKKK